MFAVIGQVRIKPGHEDETAAMARDHGPALVRGMDGSTGAYWARAVDDAGETVQHSFWLFETEADARAAATIFASLRDLPDAPADFVRVDVCEVISQM